MKITILLATSVALAGIALVAPATLSPRLGIIASAEAATISVSLFYSELGRHGDWIEHDGAYVFVPVVSDRNWRPYREGHWVYARGYGWTWVSTEPFGWATYHYGRWGFDREIGWYWVPGTRWAPAWVSWRRSGDHVAWAPLPPHRNRGTDINITISINDIPDYYWVAVPTRHFLDTDLTVVVIKDERERRRIVRETEFVGTVNVENNVVVNNIIEVNFVEENTGKKVKEVAVKETTDPAKAKASEDAVAVFKGTVSEDEGAKPTKLKDAREVKQNQAEVRQQVETEAGSDGEGATDAGNDAPAGNKAVVPGQPEGQAESTEPASGDNATQSGKKPRKVKPEQAQENVDTPPADAQAEQPADKKKKKKLPQPSEATTGDDGQANVGADDQAEDQAEDQAGDQGQGRKKAKPDEPGSSAAAPSGEAPAKAGKKGKAKDACDPAVDANCQPQQ